VGMCFSLLNTFSAGTVEKPAFNSFTTMGLGGN
jgi:hypothetical protein